ncbi:MAG: hypothetical protein JWQ04_489 [Pedosphaera sp.]|jgi:hypothetical protein|nr:hypothetical protein [Pedosphaera sp.]
MEINANMNAGGVNPLIPAKRPAAGVKPMAEDNAFASSTALEETLKKIPDLRPQAIDRARDLISDPNYPTSENLKQLAKFLAAKLTASN